MLDDAVRNHLQPMFNDSATYTSHVQTMQQNGTWSTEQEIFAAANLFNCLVICLSQSNTYYLQHFPPHFLTHCNSTCSHKTIYIINTTGTHDQATAMLLDDLEE